MPPPTGPPSRFSPQLCRQWATESCSSGDSPPPEPVRPASFALEPLLAPPARASRQAAPPTGSPAPPPPATVLALDLNRTALDRPDLSRRRPDPPNRRSVSYSRGY